MRTRPWPRLTASRAVLALAAPVILLGAPAFAQVNAEALRPGPPRAGWSGGLDLSFALASGNISLLDVGGGGRVQYQTLYPTEPLPAGETPPQPADLPPPFIAQRALLVGSARFAENGGNRFINQAFVHARWTAMWHRRIGSDVFAQYQENEFLRLQARAVAGVGFRVDIVHAARFQAWGGAAYMFEYDRIRVAPGAPDAPESWDHRLTSYLSLRLPLFGGALVAQNTLYVQPRFDAFSDLRLLDELEALVKVTDMLSIAATLGVLHDTEPPTAVKNTDVRLYTTVRLSL